MIDLTVIGIAKELECEEDVSASISGLYLDSLPGLGKAFFSPEKGLTCESKYVKQMLSARVEAIDLTQEAIHKAITANNPANTQKWAGYIGQRSGIGAATSSISTIKTANLQDAYFKISEIGVIASGEGTATVTISSPGSLAKSFVIEIDGHGYTGIPTDEKLPLNGSEYTLETEVTGTVRLQHNKSGCGCGAKDTQLFNMVRVGSSMNGVSLNATLVCDPSDAIARVYQESTDLQKVVARMVCYKAGTVLSDYILGQSTPENTDTNLEYVNARRGEFEKEFDERLLWLTETGFNMVSSHCFSCGRSGRKVLL